MMNRANHGAARCGGYRGSRRGAAVVFAAAALLVGCDLAVVNPGNMVDADLDHEVTIPAVLHGVIHEYGRTLTGLPQAIWSWGMIGSGALLTDELVAATHSPGIKGLSDGDSEDHWPEANNRWAYASRARWVANRGLERVHSLVSDPGSNPDIAVISLYGGFSNRVLGDHFCHAVRDVGPLEPNTVFYEEAEEHFTRAIAAARAALAAGRTEGVRELEPMDYVLLGAYAGRAQVRMQLGKWDEAVADAREVPTDFVHWSQYSQLGQTHNVLWALARADGSSTIWGTPFMDWGLNTLLPAGQSTGDFRVPFQVAAPTLPPAPDNRRPRVQQNKHTGANNAVANARGTEMRLIEAEAALLRGDRQAAIDRINEVRAFRSVPVPAAQKLAPVAAADMTEAWHLLMRERGIEMWLEARRLPDLRRWATVPGEAMVPFTVVRRAAASPNYEDDERVSVYAVNMLCLQIGLNEKLSNPNIGG